MGFLGSLFGGKDDFPSSVEPDQGERKGLGLSPDVQVAIAFSLTLIAGLCCAMTIVVPRLQLSAAPQQVQATPVWTDTSIPTAREAYPPAVEVIRQTDPAAELASGVGAWTPIVNAVQLESGRTGWTFHFYLPTSHQMATVIVDRTNGARVAEVKPWETPPTLLSDQGWQVDSPQAVGRLLEACRTTFESQADSQVQARLSTAADHRTLVWHLRVFSPADPLAVCEVNLDATTGLLR